MNETKDILDLDTCLQRISVADRDALEALYRQMKDPIYRYALTIMQDHSSAEDATQNSFMKIMANADQYKPGTNAKAWIYRIVRNTCIDLRRRLSPVADDFEVETVGDSFAIDDLTESIAVREALKSLTPTEREIVSLHIFAGLRQTEIAAVTGMPYIKVRSHYGYAIKKLRKELTHNDK